MGRDHAGGDAALPTQPSGTGSVGAGFPNRVKNTLGRVREVSVKGRHLVLGDGILKVLDGRLLGRAGGVGVCECEDMLGKGQQRPFRVLRIGAHVVVVMGTSLRAKEGDGRGGCKWKTAGAGQCRSPGRSTPLEIGKQLMEVDAGLRWEVSRC